jgi:alkyl sulfatase BDS1-like metallo-beta-lactamase superfamily hydrolase
VWHQHFKTKAMIALLVAGLIPVSVLAQVKPPAQVPAKPATAATKAANAKMLAALPFGDKQDFEDARRGFITTLIAAEVLSWATSSLVSPQSAPRSALCFRSECCWGT